MPVMADRWIRQMATTRAMIEPFVEQQKRDGVISYGLSSYGYDARLANEFKIFTNVNSTVIDPKKSRAMYWSSASANRPMRAAASSST